jgi:hypothetical protein
MWKKTFFGVASAIAFALLATHASGQEIIGAQFSHQLTPPANCNNNKAKMCTFVLFQAQKRPGKERAPRDGIIDTIRLVACAPGQSFVLQVVRRQGTTENFKAIRSGPVINYKGTTRNCTASNNFDIETFSNLNVPIKQGDYLAVVATQVRFHYSASSGDSLVFNPPLADGGLFRSTGGAEGFLMMQAQLKAP